MIPIYLDPASVRIALIGRGRLAARRLAWLREGGAKPDVWSDAPSDELAAVTNKLLARLPEAEELKRYHLVWIADLPKERAEALALQFLNQEMQPA